MGSFQERYNDPNICLVRLQGCSVVRLLGTERIFDQLKKSDRAIRPLAQDRSTFSLGQHRTLKG